MNSAHDVDVPVLHDVHVLDFPLDVYLLTQEHSDALVRELTLIAQSRSVVVDEALGGLQADLPERFVALVDELTHQYDGVATDVERVRDAAIDRGQTSVDLVYRVPAQIADACRHLDQVFDDADYYCRAGEHLLTLAAPPEAVAFRRWLLGEFVRQLAGEEPLPWGAYLAAHADDPAFDDGGNAGTLGT